MWIVVNLDKVNPYRPPPIPEDTSDAEDLTASLLNDDQWVTPFETDWSIDGLRSRHARVNHWPFLIAFGMVVLIAPLGLFAGVLCVLALPLGAGVGIAWIFHLATSSGVQFVKLYPALGRPTRGYFSKRFVAVQSDCCAVTTRVVTAQMRRTERGHEVSLPFAIEVAPILREDLLTPVPTENVFESVDPMAAMRSWLNWEPAHHVQGELSAADFHGTRRYQSVTTQSLILAVLSVLLFGYFGYCLWASSIPPQNRPIGTEADLVALGSGFLAVAAAGWRLISQRLSLGDFDVLVSAEGVVICSGTRRPCFAYFGEARRHFEWSEQGLLVWNRGREVMLIPRRWFSDKQVADVSRWYAEPASPPKRSLYIQPQV